MRFSSKLPPAAFTHAGPEPPGRRLPWRVPAAVLVLLVLGAGVVAAVAGGRGTAPRPAPARPAIPSSVPASSPEPGRAEAEPGRVEHRERGPWRGAAVPSRTRAGASGRPRSRPEVRPPVTRRPRGARPRAPSWISAECARRFPDDPRRRTACVAALTSQFGG
ncbi:hypothetical protein OHR68_21760 [Spirillospora sp. NBC_00431]